MNIENLDREVFEFINDGDTRQCLEDYARGFITESELAERLRFLRAEAEIRTARLIARERARLEEQEDFHRQRMAGIRMLDLVEEPDGLWGVYRNGGKIGLFGSQREAIRAYGQWIREEFLPQDGECA